MDQDVIQLALRDHPQHASALCLQIPERKEIVRSCVLVALLVVLQTKG